MATTPYNAATDPFANIAWIEAVADERTNFRYAISQYFDSTQDLCSGPEVVQHKEMQQKLQSRFDGAVSVAQSSRLRFDADVAITDSQNRWNMARSVVDCMDPSGSPTDTDIIMSKMRMENAEKAVALIEQTARLALEKGQ